MSPELPGALAGLADLLERVRRDDVRAEHLGRVPPPEEGRPSAVLVLVAAGTADGPDVQGPDVLLIERATTLRSHAGQVAFPGGACDPGDADVSATAVREAVEETGVDPAGIEVLGVLPSLYIPPSGFVVAPVLAWWREPSDVRVADPREVASVHRVPVATLAEPANRLRVRHVSGYLGPAFRVPVHQPGGPPRPEGLLVWGFTAMLLDRVLHLAGWERPWDAVAGSVLDLPADVR